MFDAYHYLPNINVKSNVINPKPIAANIGEHNKV